MSTRQVYSVVFAVVFSIFLICGAATAAVVYELSSDSTYYQGCAAPCECPIGIIGQMTGTFRLIPLRPTPLFTQYRLAYMSWRVVDPNGQVVHKITGSGLYQVGGEVARMHQLILDLRIDGNPAHFNSGLIQDDSQFPIISITVDRGTTCFDILLHVVADPIK